MKSLRSGAVALAAVLAVVSATQGQSAFYTFDPTVDQETWPASPPGLLPNDYHLTDDQVAFYNWTSNNLFIDDNYQAASNSGLISSPAVWGNPKSFGDVVHIDFVNTQNGAVDSVEFDFAWATAGYDSPQYLYIDVWDSQGNYDWLEVYLDTTFQAGGAFGGFQGAAGHVVIEPFNSLVDIEQFEILVYDVATPGGTNEIAFDNFSVNGSTGGQGDSDIEVVDGVVGISSNSIPLPNVFTLSVDVRNNGATAATYSVLISGDFYDAYNQVNLPIGGGQTIDHGAIASINSNQPSGMYSGQMQIVNNSNPEDPTETIDLGFSIWDLPQLSDNSASTINPGVSGTVSIANAAAGPHAGALRAAVRVTAVNVSGSGFSVSNLAVNDEVRAGQTLSGTVSFDATGKSPGTYNGTLTVSLEMGSINDEGNFSYLNFKPAVDDIVWNLSATVSGPGDVDGDGHVDVVDLLYLVDAFGSETGQGNYNPACDFNNDGYVDVVDLLILVENFGT